ncbi:MAG: tRNA lysidine(34) synthetase TilS [Pseudomonadota bacterium]
MLFPKFKKFMADNDLIREGDGVIVAVSGGIDSMVLLDLFCRVAGPMKLSLRAAHVNHMLRDRASGEDEALVRKFCGKMGIPCEVQRRRPPAGKNLQDAARRIRYDFFKSSAEKGRAFSIATAHHMDDQAETILLHLIRGAGLAGLAGMRPKARIGALKLVRPLLFASRAEIEQYAKQRHIEYNDDATNATVKYARNSVRHRLIPLLKEFNPRIVENIAAIGDRADADEKALRLFAEESLDQALTRNSRDEIWLSRQAWLPLPQAVRGRMLRAAFERASGSAKDLNADQLLRMDSIAAGPRPSGSYRLPAPWKFHRDGDLIGITRSAKKCDRK